VLIFPDFQLLNAAGPISVFEVAARVAGLAAAIKVVAAAPGAALAPTISPKRAACSTCRRHSPRSR
jgi:transcriptional regulator GlxA family with amidase domain